LEQKAVRETVLFFLPAVNPVSPGLPGDRGLPPCYSRPQVADQVLSLQEGNETGGNEKKAAAREGTSTALLRNSGRHGLRDIGGGRLLGNDGRQGDDGVGGLLSRGVVDSGVVVSVLGSGGGADAGGLILGEGGVDGSWGRLLGRLRLRSAAGRRGGRRGRGRGLSGEDKATSDGVGSGTSFGVHTLGAAESLVLLIVGAVVASLARVAVATRAADLAGGRVEAVDGLVGGSALGEAGTASTLASGGIGVVTLSLLGLVSVAVATSEALAGQRHESHATSRLVGHQRADGADRRCGAGQEGDGGSEMHCV
jgi:hypothetical protein